MQSNSDSPSKSKQTKDYNFEMLSTRWRRILGILRSQFGDTAFKNWLLPIKIESVIIKTAPHLDLNSHNLDGNLDEQTIPSQNEQSQNHSDDAQSIRVLSLSVPTKFLEKWVVEQYLTSIKRLWRAEDSTIDDVTITYRQPISNNDEVDSPVVAKIDTNNLIDPRFTFNTFVVNKTNELAFEAAKRVAQGRAIFNPLFLFGGVGLGKTHLLQAIVADIRKNNPEKNVVYLSAEKFMYKFVRALRDKNAVAFKEEFRSADVLLVDDIQFIADKTATQEEFFHTFNDLIDQNCHIILSADKSPVYLSGVEERIKSRMGWGMVAEVHKTDFELRLGILQTKLEKIDFKIDKEILEFLSLKITSNVRELEGALNRLIAHSTLIGKPLDMALSKEILKDILNVNSRCVTIEEIQKKVAKYYNIKMSDMHSPRRSRDVARPRQMAIFLAKILTQASLPEIGRKFGGRDHTTVIHAVKRIKELASQDTELASELEALKTMLGS